MPATTDAQPFMAFKINASVRNRPSVRMLLSFRYEIFTRFDRGVGAHGMWREIGGLFILLGR